MSRTFRALALAVVASAALAQAAGASVTAFPLPGTLAASPASQITFRGATASGLGTVSVVGSASGAHTGHLVALPRGLGQAFLLDKPFTPGESVTVKSNATLATGGKTDKFRVAVPPTGPPVPAAPARPQREGVDAFASEPTLQPPAITVVKSSSHASSDDIFVAPKTGDSGQGPMIIDAKGHLVWFHQLTGNDQAEDFKTATYQGKPVLTWWQGLQQFGHGAGVGEIYDDHYNQVAQVTGANGYKPDLHEFTVTPQGTAVYTVYSPVVLDASSVKGGSKQTVVFDSIVQEIDIKSGLVLWEWHSLGHVPLSADLQSVKAGAPYDYFHINSVEKQSDGDFLISGRQTSAIYMVDGQTGRIDWSLGGKASTFKQGFGTHFAYQHFARMHGPSEVSVFNNNASMQVPHRNSYGLVIKLDYKRKRATKVRTYNYPGGELGPSQGDLQTLSNGNAFVGWGGTVDITSDHTNENFTEFSKGGKVLFDAHFNSPVTDTYRAYRLKWSATPSTAPAVAAAAAGGRTTVAASWNGATAVASWRVLAGASPGALTAVGTAPRTDFETNISVSGAQPFVEVQALSRKGTVIGTSHVVPVTGA